ncbi:MAG: hypothetical protein IPF92_29735 [Myxococcales bacterium]|nr:hypothetical protein [Myxococcales bacterium]MBL0196863.1 hypothetical protein [Myxococcales bacterium]HQY62594.1 hypothetical protein [Polyangiaceae bacterium]
MSQTSIEKRPNVGLATSGVVAATLLLGGLALGTSRLTGGPVAHDPQAPTHETIQTLGVMYPNSGPR